MEAVLGHKFKKLDQLFINLFNIIFKAADYEYFHQILPVAR